MCQRHAADSVDDRQFSRLGELLARGALRSHQETYKTPPSPPQKSAPGGPILELFSTHADLSIGEIIALTGMSRTSVHRRLTELVKEGTLQSSGKGRGCRYHLKT